ncbi:MAG: hypothetical protein HF300_18895 [Ignavibacteria bacterium]|jgi:hypothetical protein|nr:hypothetical protein [Ignavibacteria bacterium]MCU7501308.1 hypothetical protein [Ignavibacteria bacterium]MCU7514634.1 hypothetical protein [Ignavibacteria bacterium]MCU7520492.1 hypothetical protein [Ignavibacteria bacterium]MCU7526625.1 hypothetical protein [Ignavibacteria bacterium]
MKISFLSVIFIFTYTLSAGFAGCKSESKRTIFIMDTLRTHHKRSIEEVMNAHTDELMSIPDVNGVYIGELENGQECITVLVSKKTELHKKKIPRKIEGYPVIIEETGEIRPLMEKHET